ncbi:MBOAT family protein [Shewanella submarina]|uniref:MBOAT family protein n=1 Tax=Shewanella submarina TaxID=2016376 RepID=A0ABV7G983_9GAMM|nr:MBOAT family protein [Shewanella submarina]MCL1039340.1 MBOAT family protein [Shewanella submarina]
MSKSSSLGEYVKKRNGLPLGASGSLQAMLRRSLGAESFPQFWQHWNPIWSYYLSRYVMRPLVKFLPRWLAILMTFAVSGALHDLAVTLFKWKPIFFFTPWFTFMGLVVVLSSAFDINYKRRGITARIFINISLIVLTFYITHLLSSGQLSLSSI